MAATDEQIRHRIARWNKQSKYVSQRVKDIRARDIELAEQDGIYDMTLSEFLEWFDRNAFRLFKSVGYSRIKNRHDYSFMDYATTRRQIRKIAKHEKSAVRLVRCNSKLRTSFTIDSGALKLFGSTMLFDQAVTIQKVSNTSDPDMKHCIQFSGKFKKIVEEFAEDVKSEAVYRALQDVRSTAIYDRKSENVISY